MRDKLERCGNFMDNKEEIVELTAEELDELIKDLPRILKELEQEVNQKN